MLRFILVVLFSITLVACLVDPEVSMDAMDIMKRWGYPAEAIDIETSDGYICTMHRIPFGRKQKKPASSSCRPALMFVHGMFGSSASYILNLPWQSPAFVFADAGFDVYLPNTRGNYYCRRHVNLTTNDTKFWEFTFDHSTNIDLPMAIDKVLAISGKKQLYLIGHSQGTLLILARLAEDPELAKKIISVFHMGPVGTAGHVKGFSKLMQYIVGDYKTALSFMGAMEIAPRQDPKDSVSDSFMTKQREQMMTIIHGPMDREHFNFTRFPVYLSQDPAGTSLWNLLHWSQMISAGKVMHFDYGSKIQNMIHYHSATPPVYDYSRITGPPMYLFYSENDWLATPQDVEEILVPMLNKGIIKGSYKYKKFNHLDFIFSMAAANQVYRRMIELASKDGAKGCQLAPH